MMVWLDTFTTLALSIGEDSLPLVADDDGEGFCGSEGGHDAIEGDGVITVRNQDGDAAGSDGGLFGVKDRHTEIAGLVTMVWFALLRWSWGAGFFGYSFGELQVDIAETLDHAVVDDGFIAVVQFEAQRGDDMGFLWGSLRVPEELGLGDVVFELLGLKALLHACYFLRPIDVGSLSFGSGFNGVEPVGPVIDFAGMNLVLALPVTVLIHDGTDRTVYWQLLLIDAKSRKLGVEIREIPALKKGVVRESDSGNNVAGTEGDLLGL